jgi:hypothetical protein
MLRRYLFDAMPHDLRRRLYARFDRDLYDKLQRLRAASPQDGYSLRPFDEHHCIFVHIPKAAGMSVSRALFGCLGGGHIDVRTYQLIFAGREFDDYFKFTFVRNPWDRVYSAYHFLMRGGLNEADRRWSARYLSPYRDFEDFVLRGLGRRRVHRHLHFKPQYKYLRGLHGNRPAVDFIGLFENLQEDFALVQQRLFGAQRQALGHVNRGRSPGGAAYLDHYTARMKEIVGRVYATDVALFGYRFDNASLAAQLRNRGQLMS